SEWRATCSSATCSSAAFSTKPGSRFAQPIAEAEAAHHHQRSSALSQRIQYGRPYPYAEPHGDYLVCRVAAHGESRSLRGGSRFGEAEGISRAQGGGGAHRGRCRSALPVHQG